MFYLTVWLLLNTPIKITSLLSKRDECKFILRQMTNTAMKLKDACFLEEKLWPTSVQFSHSVMSDSLRPTNHTTPVLPVHHQHREFTQTHVHQVGDVIQPSHPPSSPSPPALNLCQHQGLFRWVSSSHQVAKVLEFQLQHQSFQWTPRTDVLYDDHCR